jgi:hypothetical protein
LKVFVCGPWFASSVRERLGLVVVALVFTFTCGAPAGAAEATSPPMSTGDASSLFRQGADLFLAKQFRAAMDALRASYRLAPSPNSALLIARCLKELGQPAEAMEAYEAVEIEARRRVVGGEARYEETLEAAVAEAVELSSTLGSVLIRISTPGTPMAISVDGKTAAFDSDGRSTIWHVPGEVRVQQRALDGRTREQLITVVAGEEVRVNLADFLFSRPVQEVSPSIGDPQAVVGAPPEWAGPAAWVAGISTAVGLGVFAGFGVASRSEFDDLRNRCGPTNCGASDRAEEKVGERNQVVANVGAVTACVAAAATVLFAIFASEPVRVSKRGRAVRGSVGRRDAAFALTW